MSCFISLSGQKAKPQLFPTHDRNWLFQSGDPGCSPEGSHCVGSALLFSVTTELHPLVIGPADPAERPLPTLKERKDMGWLLGGSPESRFIS